MTLLPDAHTYVVPVAGRRCAQCDLRKRHGVHASGHIVPAPIRARHTGARYYVSGTPYLAESAVWRLAR